LGAGKSERRGEQEAGSGEDQAAIGIGLSVLFTSGSEDCSFLLLYVLSPPRSCNELGKGPQVTLERKGNMRGRAKRHLPPRRDQHAVLLAGWREGLPHLGTGSGDP